METPYESLVRRLGEAGARAEMARRRSFVKKPGGFSTLSEERRKEISRAGVEARRLKRGN